MGTWANMLFMLFLCGNYSPAWICITSEWRGLFSLRTSINTLFIQLSDFYVFEWVVCDFARSGSTVYGVPVPFKSCLSPHFSVAIVMCPSARRPRNVWLSFVFSVVYFVCTTFRTFSCLHCQFRTVLRWGPQIYSYIEPRNVLSRLWWSRFYDGLVPRLSCHRNSVGRSWKTYVHMGVWSKAVALGSRV